MTRRMVCLSIPTAESRKVMSSMSEDTQQRTPTQIPPDLIQDAHRDVLLAVQRGLAANWDQQVPRIAVVEHGGIATAYISTSSTIGPAARADIRGAVRAALAPYTNLAPFTAVVFLTRGRP